MREKGIWDDWVTYDEDGFVNGIREDAPDDVKRAYEKHVANMKELRKKGIKI